MAPSPPAASVRGIATFVSRNSGMKRDTGSDRRTFPSSTSIRMATPVTGLVIDAMGKIVSFCIGAAASMSIRPCALEVGDVTAPRDDGDGPGDLVRVDGALDHLADAFQAFRGQPHVVRLPGRHLGLRGGDREQGGEDEHRRQAGDETGSVTDTVGAHQQLLCSRIDRIRSLPHHPPASSPGSRRRTGGHTHCATSGGEYDRRMKLKTSVTLDREVVAAVEAIARSGESRSQVIERLLRQSLAARTRLARDERDRGIIDAHADELNEEALDVLGYQVET